MFCSKKLLASTFKSLNTTNRFKCYKVVVVGGGTGGISVASKFKKLNKDNLAVIEPADKHYYQPLFTLVGGGIQNLSDTYRPMKDVMPKNADWINKKVKKFCPEKNVLFLNDDTQIEYEYLVVATGIELDFNSIKGFPKAFEYDDICSNYSTRTVEKTWQNLKNFKGGNALFTVPITPIKCAGAPQKIAYLAEDYFRKIGVRDKTNIIYNSALGVIFSVPEYAKELEKLAKKRGINVNFKHNLIEVKPDKKEALFQNLDTNEILVQKYDLLHVTPPQKPAEFLKPIADQSGFVDIDKNTLQHKKYDNIFALGDCSNLPTSRTAAAIAAQCNILYKNLSSTINKTKINLNYDGYTSCPLVTSNGTCMLVEFDYNLKPKETFPFNQKKERKSMFILKKNILPFVYWNLMLKGYWNGPGVFRKIMKFGFDN